MKGDPQFVILKHQAWMDANKFGHILGAIVKEPLSPSTNYVAVSAPDHGMRSLQEGTATDFLLSGSSDTSHNVKIGGFGIKGSKNDMVKLKGKLVRFKRLQQLDQYWDSVREDADVKKTVPGWLTGSFFSRRWPVCLVVGVMICEDVEILEDSKKSKDREVKGEIPLGKIAIAAGTGLPVPPQAGEILGGKVQVKAAVSKESATIFKAKYGESRIFAVELRKVTTNLFQRANLKLRSEGLDGVDESRLAGNDDDSDEDDLFDSLDDPITADELIFCDFTDEDLEGIARERG
ncbi:hypothetical protein QBC43DRAFT_311331 [Cladorrhinum sp. PSN259]|nr:hypothetical protein QBC43DRAFT_311331 [Cladorrhinum sp. PSN259]